MGMNGQVSGSRRGVESRPAEIRWHSQVGHSLEKYHPMTARSHRTRIIRDEEIVAWIRPCCPVDDFYLIENKINIQTIQTQRPASEITGKPLNLICCSNAGGSETGVNQRVIADLPASGGSPVEIHENRTSPKRKEMHSIHIRANRRNRRSVPKTPPIITNPNRR